MATHRALDPRRLDVATFAAANGELKGEWQIASLRRLMSATLADACEAGRTVVPWQVRGERMPLPAAGSRPSLLIEAEADVTLQCQRCLQPMRWPLKVGRRIFFVEGEDAAAALDAENDDDVLALVPALDLQALLEDELLLALPIVPRHDVCPEPLPRTLVDEDGGNAPEESPFAALAVLKRGPTPN